MRWFSRASCRPSAVVCLLLAFLPARKGRDFVKSTTGRTSAEQHPKDPRADGGAQCGFKGISNSSFAELKWIRLCDPERLIERELREGAFGVALAAVRSLDDLGSSDLGVEVGVALARRTEPIRRFAGAVSKAWGLVGDKSFFVALRAGEHPAAVLLGKWPSAQETSREAAERSAARLLMQGRIVDAVDLVLAAVADAVSVSEYPPSKLPAGKASRAARADLGRVQGAAFTGSSCAVPSSSGAPTLKALLHEMAKALGLSPKREPLLQGGSAVLLVGEARLSALTSPGGHAAVDVVGGHLPRRVVDQLRSLIGARLGCHEVVAKLSYSRRSSQPLLLQDPASHSSDEL